MKWEFMVLSIIVISGCGRADDGGLRGSAATSLPTVAKAVVASGPITEWPVGYLTRGEINLTGAPGGIDWNQPVNASLAEGPAFPFVLNKNRFKYWGAALQDQESYSLIQFTQGANSARLKLSWSSTLPRSVVQENYEGLPEGGETPSDASIVIESQYGAGRVTTDSSLSIRPNNFPKFSPDKADFRLFPRVGDAINVSDSFAWDSSVGAFVLSAGENSLRQGLRDAGAYTNLDVSFTGSDGERTSVFSTTLVYAGSGVTISVLKLNSTPAVSFAGQTVVLQQKDGPFRALAVLDGNATVKVDALPAGSYSVSLYSVSNGIPSARDVLLEVDSSANVVLRDVSSQQQAATLRRQDISVPDAVFTTESA